MNRSLSRRTILFLPLAVAGCIDTAEPTGPVPQPEPDPGELTSTEWQADGTASATGRPASRTPGSRSARQP